MVTRCCPCGVGGNKKGRHRKSVPEDRKHLISSAEGSKKGRKRPVSGDSAVSNSTFASAVSSHPPPHNYEDECDARLEGQDGQDGQQEEDRRVRAKAAKALYVSWQYYCESEQNKDNSRSASVL